MCGHRRCVACLNNAGDPASPAGGLGGSGGQVPASCGAAPQTHAQRAPQSAPSQRHQVITRPIYPRYSHTSSIFNGFPMAFQKSAHRLG